MASFTIRAGDTASTMQDTLRDADENPVSIEGATSLNLLLTPIEGGAQNTLAATNDQVGDGTDGTMGFISYTWAAGDTDAAGLYLGRWKVTFANAQVQTFPNNGFVLVNITENPPVSPGQMYVTREQFKYTLNLTGTVFADEDVDVAIAAASRAVDGYTDDRFYPTDETRYFTREPSETDLSIGALNTLTSVAVDTDGNGSYETTWTDGTDFTLDPINAPLEGFPYTKLKLLRQAGRRFPPYENGIRIIGSFGWAAVPPAVQQATRILAGRFLKRARETPYGILVVSGDAVAAARLGRIDPDVAFLLDNLPGSVPLLAI